MSEPCWQRPRMPRRPARPPPNHCGRARAGRPTSVRDPSVTWIRDPVARPTCCGRWRRTPLDETGHMTVGLVLVSHSGPVAQGTADLAKQMAPSVTIAAAGGTEDGGIGTSFDVISSAIERADSGDGAIVLYDLGSALLTTETALEFCDPEQAERIRIVDAPLVEGAIAAAVTADGGGDLAAVAAAAQSAGARSAAPATGGAAGPRPQGARCRGADRPAGRLGGGSAVGARGGRADPSRW